MKYKKTKANKDRAERIAATVESYDPDDIESSVVDMLADLQHYACQNKLAFGELLKTSFNHFEAEAGGET
jgi:hypothetical protein